MNSHANGDAFGWPSPARSSSTCWWRFRSLLSAVPQRRYRTRRRPVELTMITYRPRRLPACRRIRLISKRIRQKKKERTKREKTFESNANSIAKSRHPQRRSAVAEPEGKDRSAVETRTRAPPCPSKRCRRNRKCRPRRRWRHRFLRRAPRRPRFKRRNQSPRRRQNPPHYPNHSSHLSRTSGHVNGNAPAAIRDPRGRIDAASPVEPREPRPLPSPPGASRVRLSTEKTETRITGRITDAGRPQSMRWGRRSVGIEEGLDAIGVRWYRYMKEHRDLISVGTAQIEAEVDAQGQVRNLRFVSNSANEASPTSACDRFKRRKFHRSRRSCLRLCRMAGCR